MRYLVTITNTSNPVDITITSIVDSFYGNIAALPEPNTCDSLIGVVLSSGESVTCEFTIQFTGDAGTARISTMTVTATGPNGEVVTDSAPATTITITDARPEIRVRKVVSPESRPEPGGDFVFEVTVENLSGESVILTRPRRRHPRGPERKGHLRHRSHPGRRCDLHLHLHCALQRRGR